MNEIAHSLRSQYPGSEMPADIPVVPLDIQTTGKFRLSLWVLLGSVFMILLIACTNVAGLLLARYRHGTISPLSALGTAISLLHVYLFFLHVAVMELL